MKDVNGFVQKKIQNLISDYTLSVSNILKNFSDVNEIAVKYIQQLLKNDKTLKKYCVRSFYNFITYTIGEYVFIDRDKYDNDYICLRLYDKYSNNDNVNDVLCVNFVKYYDDTVADCSIILEPHHFYDAREIKKFINRILDNHIRNCKQQEIEAAEFERQRQVKDKEAKEAFELAEFKRLSKKFKSK